MSKKQELTTPKSVERVFPDFTTMGVPQVREYVIPALHKAVEEEKKGFVKVAYLLKIAKANKLYYGLGLTGTEANQFKKWASSEFGLEETTVQKYLQVAERFLDVREVYDESGNLIESFIGASFDKSNNYYSLGQLQELANIQDDDVITALINNEIIRTCDTTREIRAVKKILKSLPEGWHKTENPGNVFAMKLKEITMNDNAQQTSQTADNAQQTSQTADNAQQTSQTADNAQQTSQTADNVQQTSQTADNVQQTSQPTSPEVAITNYLINMSEIYGMDIVKQVVTDWINNNN